MKGAKESRAASLFTTARPRGRRVERRVSGMRWFVDAAVPLALTFVAAALSLAFEGLSTEARWALFTIAEATILWSTTRIDAAYIGLAAAFFLVLVGAVPAEKLHDSLASDVVWLMIGAFVVGGALRETGVTTRLTRLLLARAKTVGDAVFWLTAAIVPLALIVPSTSARAAMMLPVFHDLADSVRDRRARRAFGLLIPTVILVSTVGSLVGAGSHLISENLLEQATGKTIGYLRWLLWGVPFSVVVCGIVALVVSRGFMPRALRERELSLPAPEDSRLEGAGVKALITVSLVVVGWLTTSLHGLDIATVTVGGALVLTMPKFGVMSWSSGLRAVSWNLVLFVAAALVLGHALIDTGAGTWLLGHIIPSGGAAPSNPLVFASVLALSTVTAHVYMPSHAARAAAFVPPILYLASARDMDPLAVVFFLNVGLDYCLTFPISSKAILVYQQLDRETFEPAELLRLSAILLPIYAALMLGFYFAYWQFSGAAF